MSRNKTPRPDRIKALILERKQALGLTNADLARIAGVCENTIGSKMRKRSSEWLSLAMTLLYAMSVPIETVREALDY